MVYYLKPNMLEAKCAFCDVPLSKGRGYIVYTKRPEHFAITLCSACKSAYLRLVKLLGPPEPPEGEEDAHSKGS